MQKEKRILKNEESLRNFSKNKKHNSVRTMGIPKGEESEQGTDNLLEEIMTTNFPSLVKENITQVQEAQSPKQVGLKEADTKTHHN